MAEAGTDRAFLARSGLRDSRDVAAADTMAETAKTIGPAVTTGGSGSELLGYSEG